jgi:hypothetical protein
VGTSGTITDINLISGGSNYSSATTTITANSGTSATAVSPVPPNGGHGADPIDAESNTFVVNNDFRVIGILKDPKLANGAQANSSVYDLTTKLTLTDISGTFQNDEVLDGGTSGASARILAFANTNASGNSGVLSVSAVTGAFSASETVTGNTSSVTATVSSIDARDLQSYSGEVLYVENRPPISRGASQIEDVKLIVRF